MRIIWSALLVLALVPSLAAAQEPPVAGQEPAAAGLQPPEIQQPVPAPAIVYYVPYFVPYVVVVPAASGRHRPPNQQVNVPPPPNVGMFAGAPATGMFAGRPATGIFSGAPATGMFVVPPPVR